jgi:universal stress protein A
MASKVRDSKMAMPLFSRILCPIDFGVDCLAALRLGRRLAERNGAALSLIHVMSPQVPGGVVLKKDKDNARVGLEKTVGSALAGIDYQIVVRGGNPVKAIIAAEAELGVDLCVMPTDGRMGTCHLFRRSITEQVARKSSCPVLTIGTNTLETKQR